jgi:16S rRNA (guanine527-N7)-methyltransferase
MEIDSDQWRKTVIEGALGLGVTVTDSQARLMGRHAVELLHWNRTTNLTAITDPRAVALNHVVDAAAAAPWIGDARRVVDAGSGGGYPGVVLKILRPDLSITLVDSVRKKVSFLKYAIRTLGLTGIEAVHGRLEALGRQPAHRQQFDLVVCRAFSSLENFAILGRPFLSPGGSLLAMKGRETETGRPGDAWTGRGSMLLGGTSFTVQTHRYRLPVVDAQRSLVLLRPTPVPISSTTGRTPEPAPSTGPGWPPGRPGSDPTI